MGKVAAWCRVVVCVCGDGGWIQVVLLYGAVRTRLVQCGVLCAKRKMSRGKDSMMGPDGVAM